MALLKDAFRREREAQRATEARVETEDMRTTDEEAGYVQQILKEISNQFRDQIAQSDMVIPDSLTTDIRKAIITLTEKLPADYEVRKRVERLSMANIVGLGAITPFMEDPEITEIVVQKWDNIVVERNGRIEKVHAAFMNEAHLQNIIGRIIQPLGKAINIQTPMVDARLPDGSRVNATIPPITPDGATLTIRRFSNSALTGEDYMRLGSISKPMLDFLTRCVIGRTSMIVSGGTGTGKTTFLNLLSNYIPKDELIITVEDSCELKLHQPNVRRMEAHGVSLTGKTEDYAVTIQDLVKNSLRMRPDRLIVGEIRDHTIVDMMSAMSTGHEGSMSTVHANSPQNLVNARMPILYGMSTTTPFSEAAQAIQISEALQLIVQLEHLRNGRRVVSSITHITGMDENNRVTLKDIFVYDKQADKFVATGYIPQKIIDKLRDRGVKMPLELFDNTKEEAYE